MIQNLNFKDTGHKRNSKFSRQTARPAKELLVRPEQRQCVQINYKVNLTSDRLSEQALHSILSCRNAAEENHSISKEAARFASKQILLQKQSRVALRIPGCTNFRLHSTRTEKVSTARSRSCLWLRI